jgi:hypothetical protein
MLTQSKVVLMNFFLSAGLVAGRSACTVWDLFSSLALLDLQSLF